MDGRSFHLPGISCLPFRRLSYILHKSFSVLLSEELRPHAQGIHLGHQLFNSLFHSWMMCVLLTTSHKKRTGILWRPTHRYRFLMLPAAQLDPLLNFKKHCIDCSLFWPGQILVPHEWGYSELRRLITFGPVILRMIIVTMKSNPAKVKRSCGRRCIRNTYCIRGGIFLFPL